MSEPYFKKRIFVRFIFTFAFLFFVGIVIVYAAQWNEPSAQPPGNNVESPINVSGTAQTKTGSLGANGGFFVDGYEMVGSNGDMLYANRRNTTGGGIWVSDDGGFYDYNNGFIDFRGTTGLRILENNGTWGDNSIRAAYLCIQDNCINSWGQVGGYWGLSGTSLYPTNNGWNIAIGTTDPAGYKLRVTGTVSGTAFYDENNTSYYVDPNSTSRLNYGVYDNLYSYGYMQASIFYDRDNISYYLDPSNSGTALKVLGSINLGSYYTNGNVGGIYFDSWPRSYITTSDDTWVNDLLLASDWNISLRATNNINFYPGGTSLNARLSGYMADTGAFVWYGSLSAANISMYESGSGCGAPNRFINFNKGGSAIYDNCDMVFQTDDNWYWYSTWHRHNEMKLNYANGDLSIRGSYYCNQSIDVAEMIYSNQKTGLEAGDVVVVDPDNDETVILSSKPYDSTVAGIISTEPGLVLGSGFEGDTAKGNVELSLVGRVPCKVTTENGPVKRGDLLVTSSKPGYAMKGDPEKIKEMPGVVLGKAMADFDGVEGKILVLISLR